MLSECFLNADSECTSFRYHHHIVDARKFYYTLGAVALKKFKAVKGANGSEFLLGSFYDEQTSHKRKRECLNRTLFVNHQHCGGERLKFQPENVIDEQEEILLTDDETVPELTRKDEVEESV